MRGCHRRDTIFCARTARTLGIPGDGGTAILLGGLTIHRIQAGSRLFTNSPEHARARCEKIKANALGCTQGLFQAA